VFVTPVGVDGADTVGRLERITLDVAIEEVPAAFVAVANALK
jgi:hypothetical protein